MLKEGTQMYKPDIMYRLLCMFSSAEQHRLREETDVNIRKSNFIYDGNISLVEAIGVSL